MASTFLGGVVLDVAMKTSHIDAYTVGGEVGYRDTVKVAFTMLLAMSFVAFAVAIKSATHLGACRHADASHAHPPPLPTASAFRAVGYTLGSLDSTGGKEAAEQVHKEAAALAAEAQSPYATAIASCPDGRGGGVTTVAVGKPLAGGKPALRVEDVEMGAVSGAGSRNGSASSDPRGMGQAFAGSGRQGADDASHEQPTPPPPITHDAALDAHVDVLRRRLMASPHPPSEEAGDASGGEGHPVIDRCNKLGTMSHRAFSAAFRMIFLAMPLAAGALNPVWGIAATVGVVGMLAVVDGAVAA